MFLGLHIVKNHGPFLVFDEFLVYTRGNGRHVFSFSKDEFALWFPI